MQRVLERMNVFLRLMHEGLTTAEREQRTINAAHEFAKSLAGRAADYGETQERVSYSGGTSTGDNLRACNASYGCQGTERTVCPARNR